MSHDSGLREPRYVGDIVTFDALSGYVPPTNVQASSAQDPQMEGVIESQPADIWERYAAHSAAYHEYFTQFLTEEAKEQLKKQDLNALLAMQTDAISLNMPVPEALPPKKYLQNIPKGETYHALVRMPLGGELIGGYTSSKLRTHDVRVHFDAGAKATPRIDIIVRISTSGELIDMHDDHKYTELRLRCNAGYRGNAQGGIDLASWCSLTLKEATDSANISQYALYSAQQVVNDGKFKEEHFRQVTFRCKDVQLVGKQSYYSDYVQAHTLFKLLHQHEGDHTFTIHWACKRQRVMESVLRHIRFAIVQNWDPYYVCPVLLTPRDIARPSMTEPISKVEDFLIDMFSRNIKTVAQGEGEGSASTDE